MKPPKREEDIHRTQDKQNVDKEISGYGRYTYDAASRTEYFTVDKNKKVFRTRIVRSTRDGMLNVDFDEYGYIIGIEIILPQHENSN